MHIYLQINPPVDDKKGIGVEKKKHGTILGKKRVLNMSHSSNADNGKSSHMNSLPPCELSESFENVNFLKN